MNKKGNNFAKKFDKHCGIAKVVHPETNQDVYVVYANFMFDEDGNDYENLNEDGEVVGVGETKEDALVDAIKNMVSMRSEYDREIEKLEKSIEKIQSSLGGHKNRIIVPITVEGLRSFTRNADVFIDWKTLKANLGTA